MSWKYPSCHNVLPHDLILFAEKKSFMSLVCLLIRHRKHRLYTWMLNKEVKLFTTYLSIYAYYLNSIVIVVQWHRTSYIEHLSERLIHCYAMYQNIDKRGAVNKLHVSVCLSETVLYSVQNNPKMTKHIFFIILTGVHLQQIQLIGHDLENCVYEVPLLRVLCQAKN